VSLGKSTYTTARAVMRRMITAERINFRVIRFEVALLPRCLILCLMDAYRWLLFSCRRSMESDGGAEELLSSLLTLDVEDTLSNKIIFRECGQLNQVPEMNRKSLSAALYLLFNFNVRALWNPVLNWQPKTLGHLVLISESLAFRDFSEGTSSHRQ
jgi:hypothetical protein